MSAAALAVAAFVAEADARRAEQQADVAADGTRLVAARALPRLFESAAVGVGAVAAIVAARDAWQRRKVTRERAARRPQIAGSRCATCDEHVVTEQSASLCAVCEAPAHVDCLARHLNEAHGPEGPGPYRA